MEISLYTKNRYSQNPELLIIKYTARLLSSETSDAYVRTGGDTPRPLLWDASHCSSRVTVKTAIHLSYKEERKILIRSKYTHERNSHIFITQCSSQIIKYR